MRQEQARDIGLFFLLGLMDERVSLAAASRVIAKIKASEKTAMDLIPPADFIRACRESWKVHRRLIPRNQPVEFPTTAWILPPELDVSVWARYQKDAPDEDIMTILFSLVLGFSDEDLAEGFQTSTGTIRYRLGKGVRQLGLVVRGEKAGLSPGAKA
jgi:hypothetical protein